MEPTVIHTTTHKKTNVRKKGKAQQVPIANVYIQASFNNTVMTGTDPSGDTLVWSSAGACGFKGPKKSTPYAATILTKNIAESLKQYGVSDVHVFVKGIGGGREASIRALHANNLNIISIKDVTPVPHNGCRRGKVRRI